MFFKIRVREGKTEVFVFLEFNFSSNIIILVAFFFLEVSYWVLIIFKGGGFIRM